MVLRQRRMHCRQVSLITMQRMLRCGESRWVRGQRIGVALMTADGGHTGNAADVG